MLNKSLLTILLLFASAAIALPQEQPITRNNLNQIEVEQIIDKFTANEEDFRFALSNYVFNRSATVQTIGLGGLITGTYRRDSFMTFGSDGQRFERILYFPMSSLTEISVTKEDLEDLGGINPFALEPRNISQYTFSYIGKQKIDELNLHVFDVRPKVIPDPDKSKLRLFTGRIWVDDQDFMIVKSKGKGIPEGDQRFPVVETWRTNVDGKYWFPAYSSSDDELVFKNGQVVKLRLRVTYNNYKQGRSEVIILDDENPVPPTDKPEEPAKDDEVRDDGLPPPPPPPPPGNGN
ncbi:MAG: hypothetical protein DWQ47_06630 [Acidobacteria bacterium]|nr:MAG: hypothetical protein DWQ32_10180 [Acidobacteriota bacterium]REK02049.1 MAG: hypothetical protein DWQ38_06610 [Acidobacteriota bacterium]REK15007.1 MAG: hypothetical protein DWQ43_15870 [Acidobacteriota bacterium]REK45721.1 MAG: hypothetical protein DWQ47_06630 [Acidobacteriota bacterium]